MPVALTAYVQPLFVEYAMGLKSANVLTDTLNVGLISNTGLASRANTQTFRYVSDLFTDTGGTALTEVVGGGYSRQALTGVTWTASALVVTLTTPNNPSWSAASFTTYYAWLHDETISSGTDATRPLLMIWDLGGVQTVTSAVFTLAVNASGLLTFTMGV